MFSNVGDRIRYLREKANFTQTDLANKLGISRSAVNAWEMSLSSPSIHNIIEMTKIFRVTADYILGITETLNVDISMLNNEQRELVLKLIECFEKNN